MGIWRLIAHHEQASAAIGKMKARNRIAIGWSDTGDLRKAKVSSSVETTALITRTHDGISGANLGGPSLWNLYHHVQKGDFVIVNAESKRKCVFEVTGDYVYESGDRQIIGYAHQRPAVLTAIDPERLWKTVGADVADGQNVRWTLAACAGTVTAERELFKEGSRFSVTSTAFERNPAARERCIEHFGCACFVCGFDFERIYGEWGRGYIHIHHKVSLSRRAAEYEVDPVKDLIPLCPNCHAMAHHRTGLSIEELTSLLKHDVREERGQVTR